ncbi:MAG: DUF72 domain-containing protein [Ardenticatenaceae bacterium]|nr:DUF72 domain-containing protein [Ardenticatenaceae bacterium]
MLYVGTSGYSYKDWVGRYYPEGLPQSEWLTFYTRDFKTTEINYTYYRLPTAATLGAMAAKVPDDFLFTIKASKELTHERDPEVVPEAAARFVEALQPLIEQEKFGCILAQFPSSFHNTPENRDYLRRLRDPQIFGDVPVVVEFRNTEWAEEEVYDLLRETNLGFCAVDQPRFKTLMPPVAVVTSPIAYVRFHGRNYQNWWQHEEAYERYNYQYSREELEEWVPKMTEMASQAPLMFAFANNHYQGQSVQTARQIEALMAGHVPVAGEPAAG